MRYLSICSGIEAATVAWHDLGWTPLAFSEIEPFPSAVLAHHYPNVPNVGDMTKYKEWNLGQSVDLLVGGTPCQAFSVAGLRQGLADARGNLTLTFVEMADHFDPEWIVWENVPGVLSSKDNAFGCFLAGLCGADDPFVPNGKWASAGVVSGPKRTVAWRVLDAQFFGVAQRRRRIFVLAVRGARNWRAASALFPIGESMYWDTAPSREAGQTTTGTLASRTSAGGGLGTDFECAGGLMPQAMPINTMVALRHNALGEGTSFGIGEPGDPAYTLIKGHSHAVSYGIQGNMIGRADNAGPQGMGVSEEVCFTLTKADQHGVAHPMAVAYGVGESPDTAHCLRSGASRADKHESTTYIVEPIPLNSMTFGRENEKNTRQCLGVGQPGDPQFTLSKAHSHAIAHPIAFSSKDYGGDATVDLAPTMRSMTHNASHANGGGQMAVMAEYYSHDYCHNRIYSSDGISPALNCSQDHKFRIEMAVRRLTPVECERLQGFPDNYTNIPWRNADQSPDGPRYKALGNSMAVPVMNWLGRRIASTYIIY